MTWERAFLLGLILCMPIRIRIPYWAAGVNGLKRRYSSIVDEKLKRIVEVDFAGYLPEAISLSELELKRRGVAKKEKI